MNHMVRIFLAVIICLLGANPKANAQNPFLTQVDYIWQFDVSPDGKYLAYKQWNKDKMSKIVVKNLSSQKEFVVDSTEMSGNAPTEASHGLTFLPDGQLLFEKQGNLLAYSPLTQTCSEMVRQATISPAPLLHMSATRQTVYLAGMHTLACMDLSKGSKKQIETGKQDGNIISLSATPGGNAIYSTTYTEAGKTQARIWQWNASLAKPADVTARFEKLVAAPYLIEAASQEGTFIVAGREGVFRGNTETEETTRLMDNLSENPVSKIHFDEQSHVLYYLLLRDSGQIHQCEVHN